MTRYLMLAEVLRIHMLVLRQSGGSGGTRDLGALESAGAQPQAKFGGIDLYESLGTKAAAHPGYVVLGGPGRNVDRFPYFPVRFAFKDEPGHFLFTLAKR